MNQPINELPVNEMNYEQAKQQLIAVIKRMETGNLPLEETLNIWERGEQLAAHCQSILDQARQRIATRQLFGLLKADQALAANSLEAVLPEH